MPDFNGPLVICGREGQADCTLCDIFKMAQKMIDFVIGLLFLIAPVFIGVGGFMILLGGANPGQIDKGKKIITNVIIGIIIALLAWTIINLIFNTLASTDKTKFPGPWNEIECTGGGTSTLPDTYTICSCGENTLVGSKQYATGGECSSNCVNYCKVKYGSIAGGDKWCCEQKVMENGCFASSPSGTWCARSNPSGSENWILSGIKTAQRGDATESLAGFINCMYQRVKDIYGDYNNLTITSISDDALCSNPPSCTPSTGVGCAHTKNSCHYGGASCAGGSNAVDFRATTVTCKFLAEQAQKCNSTAWINWEGNHLHVSVNRGTCDCNEQGAGNPCP